MSLQSAISVHAGNRYYGLNQDASFQLKITLRNAEVVWAYGVFDGHALLGELAAQTACKSFQASLHQRINSSEVEDHTIANIFRKAHRDILAIYDHPPRECQYPSPVPGQQKLAKYRLSPGSPAKPAAYTFGRAERPIEFGTTATLALYFEKTKELVVSWVGDSQAVLFGVDPEDDTKLVPNIITFDHSPRTIAERKRIEKSYPAHINSDGYLQPNSPLYKNLQINMTRALGHKILYDFGVIADPSIRRVTVSEGDSVLVIGSDGLWENVPLGTVADLIAEHTTAKAAAEALTQKATSDMRKDVDNVTALVARF